jgi:uncharacterized membrane protein
MNSVDISIILFLIAAVIGILCIFDILREGKEMNSVDIPIILLLIAVGMGILCIFDITPLPAACMGIACTVAAGVMIAQR